MKINTIETGLYEKHAPPLVMNHSVGDGIEIRGIAAVRFINFKLLPEVEPYFSRTVRCIVHRDTSEKYGAFVVDDVFKIELDLEASVLGYDCACKCIFFAGNSDFPS